MTHTDLLACLGRVLAAARDLPPLRLLPGERMALGGRRFREAPLLIEDVATALREEPALLGDLPVDPGALVARLARARAFAALHRGLAALAQQAADWALVEEVGAIDDAMAVVLQVRGDEDQPFPSLPPRQRRRRRAALLPAERHLSERQARKRRTQRRRQPAPPGAAPSPAADSRGDGVRRAPKATRRRR